MRHRAAAERHVDRHIDAIFIIGESFRFDGRWAAGDNANWKPLARRFDAQLGVLLPKVCASADATAVSVPMLMTGVPPDHHLDVAVTPSGLDRLSAAGYLTAWISNQGERDDSRDFVWSRNGFAGALDDDLIPVMAAFLGGSDPRNKAAVVHLFDSHIVYASRYPPMPEPEGLDREQLELLRYQRANDHTLLVLQEIAAVLDLQRTPAFAVYVSDHGDNLLIDHNGSSLPHRRAHQRQSCLRAVDGVLELRLLEGGRSCTAVAAIARGRFACPQRHLSRLDELCRAGRSAVTDARPQDSRHGTACRSPACGLLLSAKPLSARDGARRFTPLFRHALTAVSRFPPPAPRSSDRVPRARPKRPRPRSAAECAVGN